MPEYSKDCKKLQHGILLRSRPIHHYVFSLRAVFHYFST